MITHYGLFWSKRDVFWGVQKNPGKLLGQLGSKEAEIDFRDYKGVYCLYNDNNLAYVGQAGIGNQHTLFGRLRQHRNGRLANVWNQFSWFGVEDVPYTVAGKDALIQLEAICIAITNPGFNKQSGAFAGAKEVNQVSDEKAIGDIDTKLDRIATQLQDLKRLNEKIN